MLPAPGSFDLTTRAYGSLPQKRWRKILSKKNMVLIEAIRREKPASVTELAQRVGRRKTNVLRSLRTLQQFEIVGFEDGEGGRKAPRINYDDFRIDGRLGDASRDWAA